MNSEGESLIVQWVRLGMVVVSLAWEGLSTSILQAVLVMCRG